jgi:hypothetical protein
MKSYPEIPTPFDTDFHHQLGNKLAVFPRNIFFRNGPLQLDYWPDLSTYTEDPETTQLMYYPPHASCFSIWVCYCKSSGSWETIKFCDDLALQHSTGVTFEEVMQNTVERGLCCGEA